MTGHAFGLPKISSAIHGNTIPQPRRNPTASPDNISPAASAETAKPLVPAACLCAGDLSPYTVGFPRMISEGLSAAGPVGFAGGQPGTDCLLPRCCGRGGMSVSVIPARPTKPGVGLRPSRAGRWAAPAPSCAGVCCISRYGEWRHGETQSKSQESESRQASGESEGAPRQTLGRENLKLSGPQTCRTRSAPQSVAHHRAGRLQRNGSGKRLSVAQRKKGASRRAGRSSQRSPTHAPLGFARVMVERCAFSWRVLCSRPRRDRKMSDRNTIVRQGRLRVPCSRERKQAKSRIDPRPCRITVF